MRGPRRPNENTSCWAAFRASSCQKGEFHIEAADATFAQGEPPMPDGRFEGEVYIVMPSRSNCLLICLAATDGEVYLLRSYGDTSKLEPTEVTGHILNRKSNESIHELLAKTLKQLPGVGDATAVVTENRTILCDQIYARLATLHTKEASIAGVLDLLRKKGLLSVVDGDHAMLRAVAAIGLSVLGCSSSPPILLRLPPDGRCLWILELEPIGRAAGAIAPCAVRDRSAPVRPGAAESGCDRGPRRRPAGRACRTRAGTSAA
jgi:hypothetical protein